jgi:ankyrin repeat protein
MIEVVRLLIVKLKADPCTPDMNGDHPIHLAAAGNKNMLLRALLESGANISAGNLKGVTALHIAVGQSNVAMVNYLLEQGADINVSDITGNTALHMAFLRRDNVKRTKLYSAAYDQAIVAIDSTIAILHKHGVDFDKANAAGVLPFTTAMQRDYYKEKKAGINRVILKRRQKTKVFMHQLVTRFKQYVQPIRKQSTVAPAKGSSELIVFKDHQSHRSVAAAVDSERTKASSTLSRNKSEERFRIHTDLALFADIRIQKAVDAEWQVR